jgi:hypothetical protein
VVPWSDWHSQYAFLILLLPLNLSQWPTSQALPYCPENPRLAAATLSSRSSDFWIWHFIVEIACREELPRIGPTGSPHLQRQLQRLITDIQDLDSKQLPPRSLLVLSGLSPSEAHTCSLQPHSLLSRTDTLVSPAPDRSVSQAEHISAWSPAVLLTSTRHLVAWLPPSASGAWLFIYRTSLHLGRHIAVLNLLSPAHASAERSTSP